jgi:hypothetical protein
MKETDGIGQLSILSKNATVLKPQFLSKNGHCAPLSEGLVSHAVFFPDRQIETLIYSNALETDCFMNKRATQ